MPSSIASYDEFRRRLLDAVRDVDALAQTDPDPMIASIGRQLHFVAEWTRDARRPAQADLDKLAFGVMASRSIDDTDQRLARELYELASYLQYWPKDEGTSK